MQVGSKVYCWKNDAMMFSVMTGEPIIGDVTALEGDNVEIKSIVDDETYYLDSQVVYEIGGGPAVYQDEEQEMEMNLAYCDKIADVIRTSLLKSHSLGFDDDRMIGLVGPVEMDLHPEDGYFVSTKKTIKVSDMNGKMYKVTIEES